MDFSPHHRFRKCDRLESQIEEVWDSGDVPHETYDAYRKYHFALLHKLRSAKYHTETIASYLASKGTLEADPSEVVYRINYHFDGFCYVIASALDIFAREVLSYFGIPLPSNVYFRTGEELITKARPGDPVLTYLAEPGWKQEFSDYRNVATHESVVGTRYQVDVEMRGGTEHKKLVYPLPDDPRLPVDDRTYNRNPDIEVYVSTTLTRTLRVFNPAYGHICERIDAVGELPL